MTFTTIDRIVGIRGFEGIPARSFRDTPAIRNVSVHEALRSLPTLTPDDVAARWFPNHTSTIVPLALGLATVMTSARDAVLLAANIGGDNDSLASIAGGILGALHPDTVSDD